MCRREGVEFEGDISSGADEREVRFMDAHFGGHAILLDDFGESFAGLDHGAGFFFDFRSDDDSGDGGAQSAIR